MAKSIPYVRCELTGEMIPKNQSETVTMKITKKKGVQFKLVPITDEPSVVLHNLGGKTVTEQIEKVMEDLDKTKLPNDIVGLANPNAKPMQKPVNRMPPGFSGVFKQPGETGASEIKIVH